MREWTGLLPKPKIEQPLPPILGAAADTELDKGIQAGAAGFFADQTPMGLSGEPVTPSSQRRTLMG